MVVYKFPPQGEGKDKEAAKVNNPEFIVLDDDHQQANDWIGKEHYFETIQQVKKTNYPFALRFLTIFVSLMTMVTAVSALILCLTMLACSVLTLFQVEKVIKAYGLFWKICKRFTVCSLGFLVATISPSFGFAIIILYFLLLGEKMNNRFFSHIVNLSK